MDAEILMLVISSLAFVEEKTVYFSFLVQGPHKAKVVATRKGSDIQSETQWARL